MREFIKSKFCRIVFSVLSVVASGWILISLGNAASVSWLLLVMVAFFGWAFCASFGEVLKHIFK